jgi:RES domain
MSPRWPPLREVRWDDAHRLIPDAYAYATEPILDGDLAELAAATSRRVLVQQGRIPSGIHTDELVFGVPEWPVINAAYCYPHPLGARFSGPDRGAWYAGRELETSIAEVVFHKTVELAETDYWELSVVYQDFMADFHGAFNDLRGPRTRRAGACLDPSSYVASQLLAQELLDAGSLGVVYPSVRREGGEAVACFRPAVVNHVRRGRRVRLTWKGRRSPTVRLLR